MKKVSNHEMNQLSDAYLYATVWGNFSCAAALKESVINMRDEIQRGFVVQIVTTPVNAETFIEQRFSNVESFDFWVSQRFPLIAEFED